MLKVLREVFPDAKYQHCTVHFYRNVFSVVPRFKVRLVARMLRTVLDQESKKAVCEEAEAVLAQLREMKLKEAVREVEDSVEDVLAYCDSPMSTGLGFVPNNVIEWLNRDIRRKTRLVEISRT